MLKLLGCMLILFASAGMAYSCVRGLRLELHQMEQLMELITAVEGEIMYSRCPLPELLGRLAQHMSGPYRDILVQSSSRMEDNREADIPQLWKSVCDQYKGQFVMTGEAYQILHRTGEVFAYASLESSLQMLRFEQKKLGSLIESRHAEFAVRRKLCCCLCYTAGFCTMILLL